MIADRDNNPLHYLLYLSIKDPTIESKIKELIQCGLDINSRNSKGFTALYIAIKEHSIEMVQLLLELGADPNVCNDNNENVLHQLCKFDWDYEFPDKEELLKLLISYDADLNAENSIRKTPLHIAAANGHIAMAKALVAFEANVNCRDNIGFTPLHYAIETCAIDIAKLLLEVKQIILYLTLDHLLKNLN